MKNMIRIFWQEEQYMFYVALEQMKGIEYLMIGSLCL